MEYEQKKASLLKQKIDVDQRLANLKNKKFKATILARTKGVYMDGKKFSHLEMSIERLKQESQQIQLELSLLKLERRKEVNHHETPQQETRAGASPRRVKGTVA
jgi:hypothetical protein